MRFSLAVNSGAPLKMILVTRFPWCLEWEDELRSLFATYSAAKRRQNVLDYDDLLLHWAEMLKDKNIAAEIGNRFDILVDEYQDTNRLHKFQDVAVPPEVGSSRFRKEALDDSGGAPPSSQTQVALAKHRCCPKRGGYVAVELSWRMLSRLQAHPLHGDKPRNRVARGNISKVR